MDVLRYFERDFEQEIKDRWPDGIKPIETPFLQLMAKKLPKKPVQPGEPKPGR